MTARQKIGFVSLGAFVAAVLAAPPATAEILAGVTNGNAFESTSATPVEVPLKDNGKTKVTFTTAGNGKTLVKITYNAECMVDGPRGTWLTLQIVVNGEPAAPNVGIDYAFCTA